MSDIDRLRKKIDAITEDGFFDRQLAIGVKVEKEHTRGLPKCVAEGFAAKIAIDHLREIPDYYDRLVAMESEAKSAWRKRR